MKGENLTLILCKYKNTEEIIVPTAANTSNQWITYTDNTTSSGGGYTITYPTIPNINWTVISKCGDIFRKRIDGNLYCDNCGHDRKKHRLNHWEEYCVECFRNPPPYRFITPTDINVIPPVYFTTISDTTTTNIQ